MIDMAVGDEDIEKPEFSPAKCSNNAVHVTTRVNDETLLCSSMAHYITVGLKGTNN
jgi:hypothetical protein